MKEVVCNSLNEFVDGVKAEIMLTGHIPAKEDKPRSLQCGCTIGDKWFLINIAKLKRGAQEDYKAALDPEAFFLKYVYESIKNTDPTRAKELMARILGSNEKS